MADETRRRTAIAPFYTLYIRWTIEESEGYRHSAHAGYTDSARQVGWALQSLLKDLGREPKEMPGFDDLKAYLKLELPKGQTSIANEFLAETLLQIRAYDPKGFRDKLRATLSHAP